MKYKDFSSDIWARIEQALSEVLKTNPHPVAAFDADGTLWDTDLGETFYQYQIDNKLVPLPENPWEFYRLLKQKNNDPREAYLWLAQINRGQKLQTVRDWAEQAVGELHPLPFFPEQKKLIKLFQDKGVEVYIVTASIKWSVEPGAKLLGIDSDHVIGVKTAVQNDVITDQPQGIVTYRSGKVEALLEKTQGQKPFFACGNTMGDYQLLQSATHLALAVNSATRDDVLFKTEMELLEQAQSNHWLAHRFI